MTTPSPDLDTASESLLLEGSFDHSVDDKGRMSIPSDFRALLKLEEGSEVVVTRHNRERCLLALSLDGWSVVRERIRLLGSATLTRLVQGSARRVKVDKLGRIQLPQILRTYAQLEQGACLVVGQGHAMEIWTEANWIAATNTQSDLDISDSYQH